MSYYVVEFEFCFSDGWNSHTLRSEHLSAMEEQRRLIQSGKTFKSIFIIMFSAVILRGLVFSINLSSTLPNGEKAGAFAFVAQVLLMHFSWMISLVRQNASLVDFAWPAGLAYMATNYGVWGKAYELRRYLICAMYLMHSSRRVLAWWVTHSRWSNEDRRYAIWRERWTSGQAWFKSKSVEMNFLVFFQSRAIINTFVLSVPLHLTCVVFPPAESAGLGESLHWLEVFAFLVWCVAFGTQIVADQQLANFHRFERLNDGAVPRQPGVYRGGLWQYCRHPNYFCEWVMWCALALYAVPSIRYYGDVIGLLLVPTITYYYLVHFTGVWITEQSSMRRRGAEFRQYKDLAPAFFPWFPRKKTG